jgi:hypothetical protein
MSSFPVFDLAESAFEDAINAVVLYFEVVNFTFVAVQIVLKVLVF